MFQKANSFIQTNILKIEFMNLKYRNRNIKMFFENETYSWSNMSLTEYINEGNIPSLWLDFFNRDDVKICIENISSSMDRNRIIYPPPNDVFKSFYVTPPEKIKVVLLGMDPYHSGTNEFDGSATGLCFSIKQGNTINPSLKNIYKELRNNNFHTVEDGDLSYLTKEGVFLLNTALTVEKGNPDSHTSYWSEFSELLIQYIVGNTRGVVWLLFGNNAIYYDKFIDKNNHKSIKTSHPSPFSALRSSKNAVSFIGSNVFRKCNECLLQNGHEEVRWSKNA
jgi:uracil-DNA glycosylase